MFSQIDMLVSLRHASDSYMEEVTGIIISIIHDLCESHLNGDPDMLSMLLAVVLAQSRPTDLQGNLPPDIILRPSPYSRDPWIRLVKLDWFYMLDGRFWKMAKFEMRQIYARIYTVNPGVQDLLGT